MTPTTKGISAIDFIGNPEKIRFLAACSVYRNETAGDTALSMPTYSGLDLDTPTFSFNKQEVASITNCLTGTLLKEAAGAPLTSFWINWIKGVHEGDTYGTFIEQEEINLLRSFIEGRTVSRPVVVPLFLETEAFCNREGIRKYVNVASDLINQCFSNIEGVDSDVLQDPETEDQLLVIHLEVKGEIEAVLDMYDKYTEEWVSRVPWPERGKISLSYIII